MPTTLGNMFYDMVGIARAISYRMFRERSWSPPQPMFNIMKVKEGTIPLFEDFLRGALQLSLKSNTPLSLGAFLNEETRTFIYITEYASTGAYIKVDTGLLTHGLAYKRAKATQKTSWTYVSHSQSPQLKELQSMLMVGVQGSPRAFLGMMNRRGLGPEMSIRHIKDVRGRSLGHYYVFADSPELRSLLDTFREDGGDFCIYEHMKMMPPK